MKNADMPALPIFNSDGMAGLHPELLGLGRASPLTMGLTKRECFALMTMQGILSCGGVSWTEICKDSVILADALLEELGGGE